MTDKKRIKELEKKVIKLEKQIAMKDSLIELLRVLPGNKHIKLGLTKEGKKINVVSKGAQGKSRLAAAKFPSREAVVASQNIGSNAQDASKLED